MRINLWRAACALSLLSTLAATTTIVRPIDAAHSTATFSVAHIWVEHVTGTVPIVDGSVTLAPGSAIPLAATAVLDATKIATGEPDRDRALESPDFFDSAKFPTWTFASTSVTPRGPDSFEMDGDLTIHGVTRSEHLDVTLRGTPDHPSYRAVATIDRHAFGMATTRLDPVIGSTAVVTIEIALK